MHTKAEQVLTDEEILKIYLDSTGMGERGGITQLPECVFNINCQFARAIEKEVMDRCNQPPPTRELWPHVKSGGVYEYVTHAILESDCTPIVVYKNIADGHLWVRPTAEFHDGRFVKVDDAVAQQVSKTVIDNAWRALKLAITICDLVPSHAHEQEDGPLKSIAKLVNNDGGTHGYAFIRDSLHALENFMLSKDAQPVSTSFPEVILADDVEERFKTRLGCEKLIGLDRLAARLAMKMNAEGSGLLDMWPAVRFAKTLYEMIGAQPVSRDDHDKNVMLAMATSLADIHEHLGLDPDDAEGAGPIIEAIDSLRDDVLEACAKICEETEIPNYEFAAIKHENGTAALNDAAKAIRALKSTNEADK